MTIPASPTNQWGPYYTSNIPVNVQFVNALPAPAPGAPPTAPQSPAGSSDPATSRTSGFNYVHSISSTQQYLQNVMRIEE